MQSFITFQYSLMYSNKKELTIKIPLIYIKGFEKTWKYNMHFFRDEIVYCVNNSICPQAGYSS